MPAGDAGRPLLQAGEAAAQCVGRQHEAPYSSPRCGLRAQFRQRSGSADHGGSSAVLPCEPVACRCDNGWHAGGLCWSTPGLSARACALLVPPWLDKASHRSLRARSWKVGMLACVPWRDGSSGGPPVGIRDGAPIAVGAERSHVYNRGDPDSALHWPGWIGSEAFRSARGAGWW